MNSADFQRESRRDGAFGLGLGLGIGLELGLGSGLGLGLPVPDRSMPGRNACRSG